MRLLLTVILLLAWAGLAWAHSDEDHDDEPAAVAVASDIELPDEPSYHQHIRPIIEASCVSCHSEGQIAAYAPFSQAEDVLNAAQDIAWHVTKRLMPPWMPSPENLPLQHDRSLSDREIALIAAWAGAGAPLGDEHDYAPSSSDVALPPAIRADLTLELSQAYTPSETVLDDYRCFAFPLGLEAPRYIAGYEFIPDVREMAHHGILYLVDQSLKAEIEARDSADGRLGWDCYGTTGLSRGGSIIATWTPGASPVRFPAGTGVLIKPGQFIIMQMHYNLWTARQPDQSRTLLELADADQPMKELAIIPLQAPVEIPCPAGHDGPQCQRETAIMRLGQRFGAEMSRLPDRQLRRCRQSLADYADNTGEKARGFCDFPSPFAGPLTVYSALGHMHELGSSFRMTLNPDGDEPQLLLDIPRWDFHWQDQYFFAEPVTIKPGDVLRISCVWDNSRSDEPRYVVWGEGTSDEMCFGTLLALEP